MTSGRDWRNPNNDRDKAAADFRMRYRLSGFIHKKVLLGDVGGVVRLLVLGEQVIIGLIFLGANFLGNRLPPFLGVIEGWVDVEDHAPKGKEPVPNNLSNPKFRLALQHPELRLVRRRLRFNA